MLTARSQHTFLFVEIINVINVLCGSGCTLCGNRDIEVRASQVGAGVAERVVVVKRPRKDRLRRPRQTRTKAQASRGSTVPSAAIMQRRNRSHNHSRTTRNR